MWHVTLGLHDDRGGDLVITAEFVRGPASVCLQGRYRDSGWGGYACLFPPRPWQVLLESWRLFPLPSKAMGLPPEPGVVELRWTDANGAQAVAVGREARWGPLSAGHWQGLPEGAWLPLGRAVLLPEGGTGLETLQSGCVAVAPCLAQQRGAFERLLEAAAAAGCSAVLILQGGRPQLPRAARKRGPAVPGVPVFTVSALAVEDRSPELAGAQLAARPASSAALLAAGWAERLGVVEA